MLLLLWDSATLFHHISHLMIVASTAVACEPVLFTWGYGAAEVGHELQKVAELPPLHSAEADGGVTASKHTNRKMFVSKERTLSSWEEEVVSNRYFRLTDFSGETGS